MSFFPISKDDLSRRNWDSCDIIIVSGDAYVDHPSFGTAIIARVIESAGYKVGIIAQPNWRSKDDITCLGRPRLGFAVTSGNIDSMVAHYTVNHKKRRDDAYTPGNIAGKRPNRASIVYTNLIRSAYKDTPVILGGVEASLRRTAHYDYWSDSVRKSILIDSKADILVYGMGEAPIVSIVNALDQGIAVRDIRDVPGTVVRGEFEGKKQHLLPSFDAVSTDKKEFNHMTKVLYENRVYPYVSELFQDQSGQMIKINPPQKPLSQEELDAVYALPYEREPHPSYKEKIPAWDQIKNSITCHRGCFGNCSFCAITSHQGPEVQSRSERSVLDEVEILSKKSWFKGTVSDIGGPTANMYALVCKKGGCKERNCLYPVPCRHLAVENQVDYTRMLRKAKKIQGVKHVYVASGLRHDLALANPQAMEIIIREFTGGHLKIAPEHLEDRVTAIMNKPRGKVYFDFLTKFRGISARAQKQQFIVPYFISGHPGCTDDMMQTLAEHLKRTGHKLQQAADFYPTPMTLATAMYYTGMHPLTGEKLYVAKTYKEKKRQFDMMMWYQKGDQHHRKK